MGYLLPISIGLLVLGYFLRKRAAKKSSNELKENPTISKDIWTPLDFNTLQKQFSPGTKGRNEGSNNSPSTSSEKICATEGEIVKYVKNHYNKKLREIDGFEVGDSKTDLQTVFRNSQREINRNGYLQEYNKMAAAWEGKLRHYVVKVKSAIKSREVAREAVRTYKIQNNIIAGRHPQVHKKGFQIMKILIPFFLFSVEVFLNITGLVEVISGSEALITAVMVSCINVGLSFSVGFLVLTHLFNPVGTSKSKLFYSIVLILFTSVLVYINCMMGVFRASTEVANNLDLSALANDAARVAEQMRINNEAMYAAVYPFDDLNKITFSGSFLMLVGFFFSFVSLLDGYFFKDPIPGFGKLGQERKDTENRAEKLKNEESMIFTSTEEFELMKLNQKHEARLEANETWKFYVDQLQIQSDMFERFNEHTREVLESAIDSYREQNMKYRNDSPPSYFNSPIPMNFIKTFKESFAHLADEFKSDYEVNEISRMNEEKIDSEYRNMHDIYIQFFRDEKTKLFEIVENIDG